MFEHIHFEPEITFQVPSNFRQTSAILSAQSNASQYSDLKAYYEEQPEDVDFRLAGKARSIFPGIVTSRAREHLLYLQVFCLLDASMGYYTQRCNYNSYLLLHTYDGQGKLEYDGHTYTLCQGDSFLIDCSKFQRYYTSGSHWNVSNLHFNGNPSKLLYNVFYEDSCPVVHHSSSSPYQADIEHLLLESQSSSLQRDIHVSLALETLLIHLIDEKNKSGNKVPDYIIYLQKYLDSNFAKQLSLDELSAFTNISKYHLSREFHKYIGYSINEYIIELRLSRAEYLLSNSPLSIGQIADITGFTNYTNFYNLFRKKYHMTPREYQRQN